MTERVRSRNNMIAGMTPVLRHGVYGFVSLSGPVSPILSDAALASFREEEGMSLILPGEVIADHALTSDCDMRCITLTVYSALEGVGLTAAVSQTLSEAHIACNMVAAYHHDHVFVPAEDADRALQALLDLQASAGRKT